MQCPLGCNTTVLPCCGIKVYIASLCLIMTLKDIRCYLYTKDAFFLPPPSFSCLPIPVPRPPLQKFPPEKRQRICRRIYGQRLSLSIRWVTCSFARLLHKKKVYVKFLVIFGSCFSVHCSWDNFIFCSQFECRPLGLEAVGWSLGIVPKIRPWVTLIIAILSVCLISYFPKKNSVLSTYI